MDTISAVFGSLGALTGCVAIRVIASIADRAQESVNSASIVCWLRNWGKTCAVPEFAGK